MSLHVLETKLFAIAGSMRNFADVADRCTVTEVVNGPPSIRTWAEMLDEIRGELAALAGGGEAVGVPPKAVAIQSGGLMVTDEMVAMALKAHREQSVKTTRGKVLNQTTAMRAALTAALNPGGSRE